VLEEEKADKLVVNSSIEIEQNYKKEDELNRLVQE
jgi:hypothetical protein